MAKILHGRHAELFEAEPAESRAVRAAVRDDIGTGDFVHIMGFDEENRSLDNGVSDRFWLMVHYQLAHEFKLIVGFQHHEEIHEPRPGPAAPIQIRLFGEL